MRQVMLQVPRGAGDPLVELAGDLGASALTRLEATGGTGDAVELLVVTVPNAGVGPLIDHARGLGEFEATIPATGAFAFDPPAGEPPEQLLDVTTRSAYEVVLAGRQAAGSWRGFVTYAAVAGVVVWLGLYTETIYLLTAAMLIAPFAGPAMNTAISIVSGQPGMLRHSLARYTAGIAVTAAVSGLLAVVVGQEVVTDLMTATLTVSLPAFLLPVAAGVAGASYLVQSEHSSLISGAAVGILVAASLAPPAGGLGIALALGRPDLALHALFLVALQLTGITASSIVVLWLYGIRPGSQRFGAQRPRMLMAGLTAAVALTGALVATQVVSAPFLTQGSEARHAAEAATAFLDRRPDLDALGVEARVASAQLAGPPRVVVQAQVEPDEQVAASPRALESDLEAALRDELQRRLPSTVPHADVTVFQPAPG